MKNIRIIIAALAVTFLTACTKVPAGYVGVKFDLYGSDKGVTGEVVGPGKYWLGWNEDMYTFPTFTQNEVWTADIRPDSPHNEEIVFQDRDGTQLSADIGVSYAVRADKADTVFQKYRKGISEITDVYVRNMIRDAINNEASKMEVTDIYGPGKEQLMTRVTDLVRSQVRDIGIDIEKVYLIGAMRLPATITTSINAKIEATQKAQQRENELQTAKAQAEIEREKARGEADAVLISAKAEADANKLKQASLTKEIIEYTYAQRWDGKLPTTTGGVVPFINVK